MASALDMFISYKFIKVLTTEWEDMEAFDLGIIDNKGKVLRKYTSLSTSREQNSYTVFHRLIFNIKRLLEKLPFGKSKLVSFTAGLFLLKENAKDMALLENIDKLSGNMLLDEEFEYFLQEQKKVVLPAGIYKLVSDVFVGGEGEVSGKRGDEINVPKNLEADEDAKLLGDKFFTVTHIDSGKDIVVSLEDLTVRDEE